MKTSSSVGLVLATLHGALVVYVVQLILSGIEPDWPMYWMIFMPVDFPFSLLAMIIGSLLGWIPLPDKLLWFSPNTSPLNDVWNFWIPLFVFGVLGTLWQAFLPSLLMSAAKKLKQKYRNK